MYITEKPDLEELMHFGVLGMKWGHHKTKSKEPPQIKTRTKSISTKLKDGSTFTMEGHPTPKMAMFLAKHLPGVRKNVNNTSNFTLKDKQGKAIGDMTLYKESKTSLNVVWVGVHGDERGKGYASAAMKGAIKFAKSQGLKTVTLEVPGNSPDARHIYEKLGFKAGEVLSKNDPVWGGLQRMKLDI